MALNDLTLRSGANANPNPKPDGPPAAPVAAPGAATPTDPPTDPPGAGLVQLTPALEQRLLTPAFQQQFVQRWNAARQNPQALTKEAAEVLVKTREAYGQLLQKYSGRGSDGLIAEGSTVDNLLDAFARGAYWQPRMLFNEAMGDTAEADTLRQRMMLPDIRREGGAEETVAEIAGNVTPTIAGIMAAPFVGGAAAGLGIGAYYGLQGFGAGREAIRTEYQQKYGVAPSKADEMLSGVGYAIAEMVPEAVGAGILMRIGGKALSRIGENTLRQLLQADPGAYKAFLKAVGGATVGASMEEGFEEGLTQVLQNWVDKQLIDPMQALSEGVGEAALTGLIAGPMVAPFAVGSARIADRRTQRQLRQESPADVRVRFGEGGEAVTVGDLLRSNDYQALREAVQADTDAALNREELEGYLAEQGIDGPEAEQIRGQYQDLVQRLGSEEAVTRALGQVGQRGAAPMESEAGAADGSESFGSEASDDTAFPFPDLFEGDSASEAQEQQRKRLLRKLWGLAQDRIPQEDWDGIRANWAKDVSGGTTTSASDLNAQQLSELVERLENMTRLPEQNRWGKGRPGQPAGGDGQVVGQEGDPTVDPTLAVPAATPGVEGPDVTGATDGLDDVLGGDGQAAPVPAAPPAPAAAAPAPPAAPAAADNRYAQARQQGYIEFDDGTGAPQRVERLPKLTEQEIVLGKARPVSFRADEKVPARYAVVEASRLAASHRRGRQNPRHFLPEAQPRDRSREASRASAEQEVDIATRLDPLQTMEGATPYVGAPVVNTRGEAIQGNGRIAGVQRYWEDFPQDPKGYKRQLVEDAAIYGLQAELVEQLQAPVLVRLVATTDAESIRLGQFRADEGEAPSSQTTRAKGLAARMKDAQRRRLLETISEVERRSDDDQTLAQVVRRGMTPIVDTLVDSGVIQPKERETITAEEIQGLLVQMLLTGGDQNIPSWYESQVPETFKKGLERALPQVLLASERETVAQRLREAVAGWRAFQVSSIPRLQEFLLQFDMSGQAQVDRYTLTATVFMNTMDTARTQADVTDAFKEFARLLSGGEFTDMFGTQGVAGLPESQALQQAFADFWPTYLNARKQSELKARLDSGAGENVQAVQEQPAAPGVQLVEEAEEAATETEAEAQVEQEVAEEAGEPEAAAPSVLEGMPARDLGQLVGRMVDAGVALSEVGAFVEGGPGVALYRRPETMVLIDFEAGRAYEVDALEGQAAFAELARANEGAEVVGEERLQQLFAEAEEQAGRREQERQASDEQRYQAIRDTLPPEWRERLDAVRDSYRKDGDDSVRPTRLVASANEGQAPEQIQQWIEFNENRQSFRDRPAKTPAEGEGEGQYTREDLARHINLGQQKTDYMAVLPDELVERVLAHIGGGGDGSVASILGRYARLKHGVDQGRKNAKAGQAALTLAEIEHALSGSRQPWAERLAELEEEAVGAVGRRYEEERQSRNRRGTSTTMKEVLEGSSPYIETGLAYRDQNDIGQSRLVFEKPVRGVPYHTVRFGASWYVLPMMDGKGRMVEAMPALFTRGFLQGDTPRTGRVKPARMRQATGKEKGLYRLEDGFFNEVTDARRNEESPSAQISGSQAQISGSDSAERGAEAAERAPVEDRVSDREIDLTARLDEIDEEIDDLWNDLGSKLGGQLGVGIDPEAATLAMRIAAKYAEKGIVQFEIFARRAIERLGTAVRPYLKGAWKNARSFYTEAGETAIAEAMTPDAEVDAYDLAALASQQAVQPEDQDDAAADDAADDAGDVEEARYKYGSTQFNLGGEVQALHEQLAGQIAEDDLFIEDGDYGREDEAHVTIKFGLTEDDAGAVAAAVEDLGPVTLRFGKTSLFENDKFDVVKVDVERTPSLVALHERIKERIPNEDTYPDYKPHLTVAYVKKGRGKKYAGLDALEGQEVTLTEFVVSTRDREHIPVQLAGGTAEAQAEAPAWDFETTFPLPLDEVRPTIEMQGEDSPIPDPDDEEAVRAWYDDVIGEMVGQAVGAADRLAEARKIRPVADYSKWVPRKKGLLQGASTSILVLDGMLQEYQAYYGLPARDALENRIIRLLREEGLIAGDQDHWALREEAQRMLEDPAEVPPDARGEAEASPATQEQPESPGLFDQSPEADQSLQEEIDEAERDLEEAGIGPDQLATLDAAPAGEIAAAEDLAEAAAAEEALRGELGADDLFGPTQQHLAERERQKRREELQAAAAKWEAEKPERIAKVRRDVDGLSDKQRMALVEIAQSLPSEAYASTLRHGFRQALARLQELELVMKRHGSWMLTPYEGQWGWDYLKSQIGGEAALRGWDEEYFELEEAGRKKPETYESVKTPGTTSRWSNMQEWLVQMRAIEERFKEPDRGDPNGYKNPIGAHLALLAETAGKTVMGRVHYLPDLYAAYDHIMKRYGRPEHEAWASPNAQKRVLEAIRARIAEVRAEMDQVRLARPGKQRQVPGQRVARLLRTLALDTRIFDGFDAHFILRKPNYFDLVIERHGTVADGDARLYVTHYRDEGGDRFLDAEMVFEITRGGMLILRETATINPLAGGESRGYDKAFANAFASNLIHQGWEQAELIKPEEDYKHLRPEQTDALFGEERERWLRKLQHGQTVWLAKGLLGRVYRGGDRGEQAREAEGLLMVSVEGTYRLVPKETVYPTWPEHSYADGTWSPTVAPEAYAYAPFDHIEARRRFKGAAVPGETTVTFRGTEYVWGGTDGTGSMFAEVNPEDPAHALVLSEALEAAILQAWEHQQAADAATSEAAEEQQDADEAPAQPSLFEMMGEEAGEAEVEDLSAELEGKAFDEVFTEIGRQRIERSPGSADQAAGYDPKTPAVNQVVFKVRYGSRRLTLKARPRFINPNESFMVSSNARVGGNGALERYENHFIDAVIHLGPQGLPIAERKALAQLLADEHGMAAHVRPKADGIRSFHSSGAGASPATRENAGKRFDPARDDAEFEQADESGGEEVTPEGGPVSNEPVGDAEARPEAAPPAGAEGEVGGGTEVPGTQQAGGLRPADEHEERTGRPYGQAVQHLAFAIMPILRERLKSGKALRMADLQPLADAHFGGTQADGVWRAKDLYEAMEVAVSRFVYASPWYVTRNATWARQIIERLEALTQLLPTQTRRTSEQIEFQQFSTPPAYAYLAAWAAGLKSDDVILEPSAGTGNLATMAATAHPGPGQLILNEWDEQRHDILRAYFAALFEGRPDTPVGEPLREDASQLYAILHGKVQPTAVVMNPPFSRTGGRVRGKMVLETGARHVEEALRLMADGGRLVAIVGRGMTMDAPTYRAFWRGLEGTYTVRANIGIGGDVYKKYGTTFATRLLIIDKRAPQDGETTLTEDAWGGEEVTDLAALVDRLEDIRYDRPDHAPGKPASKLLTAYGAPGARAGGRAGSGDAAEGATERLGTGSANPATGGTAAARPHRGSGGAGSGEAATGAAEDRDAAGPQTGAAGSPGRGGAGGGAAGSAQSGARERTGRSDSDAVESEADSSVQALDVEAVDTSTVGEQEAGGLFEHYQTSITLKGSKPHPGILVETASMASVQAPPVSYQPNLPKRTVTTGALSLAQIENVARAGQAHSQILPSGERRGYFIGDGTGVGKARQVAGIILDNWRRGGVKRAAWITVNDKLYDDANREFEAIGGGKNQVHKQKLMFNRKKVPQEGILFSTYTLFWGEDKVGKDGKIKQGRFNQLIEWLTQGEDPETWDGVIVFDEAHKLANAISAESLRGSKDPSRQALAGVELQRKLPKARIVYASATGATEVRHFAYVDRLGLWGEGTPFRDKQEFIGRILEGGVAAMEAVAMNLKAMGAYTARSLSYEEVRYDELLHELQGQQQQGYDVIAKAWQIILQNINEALQLTGGDQSRQAKRNAKGQFWGSMLRFYETYLTALKTPSMIQHAQRALDEGGAVVVQLTKTGEAALSRAVEALQADSDDEIAYEEIDLSPRDTVIAYLERSFPVQRYEERMDEDGNIEMVAVKDAEGNPVLDPRAVDMRDQMIDYIRTVSMPDNPIDQILNAFGHQNVAEITGRSQRVQPVEDEYGQTRLDLVSRTPKQIQKEIADFRNDKRRVLIFSEAGGTGASYHASLATKNQRPRTHYLLQPGWRAESAMQGLGRTHRTAQASAPLYVLVTTDLKGERRFLSSIARRLDQLGALTRGSRKAASQGIFSPEYNLENEYAAAALRMLWQDVARANVVGFDTNTVEQQMGLPVFNNDGGLADPPEVRKFLNRLLTLTVDVQNDVFEAFFDRLSNIVRIAQQEGTFDTGVEDITAETIEKQVDQVVYTDEQTGGTARYVRLELTDPLNPTPWDMARDQYNHAKTKMGRAPIFTQNSVSGMVYLLTPVGERTRSDGTQIMTFHRLGIRADDYVYEDGIANYKPLDLTAAQSLWQKEVDAAPPKVKKQVHMVVGLLLPVWDRIVGSPKIKVAVTASGERLLGRIIPQTHVEETLRNLGAVELAQDKVSDAELLRMALNEGAVLRLANGWRIGRRRLSGEQRLELVGPVFEDTEMLAGYGLFHEIIERKQRFFIPADAQRALPVFRTLTKYRPVVEVLDKDGVAIEVGTPQTQEDLDRADRLASLKPLSWWTNRGVGFFPGSTGIEILEEDQPAFVDTYKAATGQSYMPRSHTRHQGTPLDPGHLIYYVQDDRLPALAELIEDVREYHGKSGGTSAPAYEIGMADTIAERAAREHDVRLETIAEERDRTQEVLDRITGAWKDAGGRVSRVQVVAMEQELPGHIRRDMARRGAVGDVVGVYDPPSRTHYVVLANVPGATETARQARILNNLVHEQIGHHGVRQVLGARIVPTLRRIYASYEGDPYAEELARAYGFDLTKEGDQLRLADELVAHLATSGFRPKLLEQLIAEVRRWLRQVLDQVGLSRLADRIRFTDTDLALILSDARQYVTGAASGQAGRAAVEDGDASDVALPPGSYEIQPGTFYSQLHHTLADMLPASGTPGQMIEQIEAHQRKGRFKKEELEWTGLVEWLQEQTDRVTKEDVLAYVREHGVEIEEVVLEGVDEEGPESVDVERVQIDLQRIGAEVSRDMDGHIESVSFQNAIDPANGEPDVWLSDADIAELAEYLKGERYDEVWNRKQRSIEGSIRDAYGQEAIDLLQQVVRANEQFGYQLDRTDGARYQEYTLRGGTNYREVLLKMAPPPLPPGYEVRVKHRLSDGELEGWYVWNTEGGYKETRIYGVDPNHAIWEFHELKAGRPVAASSPHFQGHKQILAHTRLKDRRGPSGERVLFVEEVQSDLHQRGRDVGYATQEKLRQVEALARRGQELMHEMRQIVPELGIGEIGGPFVAFWDRAVEEHGDYRSLRPDDRTEEAYPGLTDLLREYREVREARVQLQRQLDGMVPDAPFKSSWMELVMKRVLRMAAENGYDAVAWTSGRQQSERYSLNRFIRAIDYRKAKGAPGEYVVRVIDRGGKQVYGWSRMSESDLAEWFGKEVAEQVVADAGVPLAEGTLESKRLDVGDLQLADRHKTFVYDEMLPRAVRKLTKKWDAVVTQVELDGLEGEGPVWAVAVTPKLQASVLLGQPLFERKAERERDIRIAQGEAEEGDVLAARKEPRPSGIADQLAYELSAPGTEISLKRRMAALGKGAASAGSEVGGELQRGRLNRIRRAAFSSAYRRLVQYASDLREESRKKSPYDRARAYRLKQAGFLLDWAAAQIYGTPSTGLQRPGEPKITTRYGESMHIASQRQRLRFMEPLAKTMKAIEEAGAALQQREVYDVVRLTERNMEEYVWDKPHRLGRIIATAGGRAYAIVHRETGEIADVHLSEGLAERRASIMDAERQVLEALRGHRKASSVHPALRRHVAAMRAIEDGLWGYLEQAHKDGGAGKGAMPKYLKNHVRRIYDREKLERPEVRQAFTDLIARYLVDAAAKREAAGGVSLLEDTDPRAYAEEIYTSIVYGRTHGFELDMDTSDVRRRVAALFGLDGSPGSLKERGLWFIPDKELEPFLVNDLGRLFTLNVTENVTYAEYIRRFGYKNQIGKKIWNAIRVSGRSDVADVFRDALLAQRGTLHLGQARFLRRPLQAVRTVTMMSTMSFAAIAALVELTTPIARMGVSGIKGYKALPAMVGHLSIEFLEWAAHHAHVAGLMKTETHQKLYQALERRNQSEMVRFAQQIGAVSHTLIDQLYAERLYGYEKPLAKWEGMYFKLNMLEPVTLVQRAIAAHGARYRVREILQAKELAGELERDAERLGLPKEARARRRMLDWLDEYEAKGFDVRLHRDPSFVPFRNAVVQLTDQTVVMGSPATRPLYGSSHNPFLQLAHQLQSFIFAFREGPLAFIYDEYVRHGLFSGEADEAAKAALMLAVRVLIPILTAQWLADETRKLIQYDSANPEDRKLLDRYYGDDEPVEKVVERLERAGFMGPTGRLYQIAMAPRYGQGWVTAALGPAASQLDQLGKGVYRLYESGEPDALGQVLLKLVPGAGQFRRFRAGVTELVEEAL